MHECSPFSFFFPKLIIIFVIAITARTTQRLSKRSAKRQKVIQPRAVPVLSKRSAIYIVQIIQILLLARLGREGGDSRGIRTCMPIVGVANTLVAVVVLHQSVMSLKKATVENAKGLHICCTNEDSHATIMTVQCPKTFNLSSVIINRESLNRLCGYGATTISRYLDDQVSKDCMENKLSHVLLTPILINWIHSLQAINFFLFLFFYFFLFFFYYYIKW